MASSSNSKHNRNATTTGPGKADDNGSDSSTSVINKRARETTVVEVSDSTNDDDADSEVVPGDTQYPTGAKFWLLMLNLGAVIILGAIDMSIVSTAVPRITDHFHMVADVGWYSIAFRLTQCSFKFLYGKAYKVFSIKRVFLLSNVFSFLGSVLCAAAVSSPMLVVGRAVAGIGTAGMDAGATLMLVQSVPLRKRPAFLGLWGAIEGVSTIAGPLLGGAITQTIGWRWCFWINLPIGGATLLLTLLCFAEQPRAGDVAHLTFKQRLAHLDIVSNLLLVPALTCLFLAFSWAGTKYPWNDGKVIGLIVTFGVLASAFIFNQFRLGDTAALPIRIIKQRSVLASFVFIFFFNSAGNVLEYYLPIYYQAVHGYTPAQSGYLMLPILVVATLGAIGTGIATGAIGYYAPSMLFASMVMPLAAGLITTWNVHTGLAKIIGYTALSGLGYGVGSIGPSTAVQTVLAETDVPLGLAALMFSSAFGPAVMIAIAQVIFTNQLSKNLDGLLPDGTNIDGNGLTELVNLVPPAKVQDVLVGIQKSLAGTWYLVVALACAMLLGSLPVEWRSVKEDKSSRANLESVE